MIGRFQALFGVRASWSWLEKGHGKGPCDGVGGSVKKLADRLIKNAKIIDSTDKFYDTVSEATTAITLLKVERKEIEQKNAESEEWHSRQVSGIMNSHMVTGIGGHIYIRNTSCFRPCCYNAPTFSASCSGWKKTCIPVITHYDMDSDSDINNDQTEAEPNDMNVCGDGKNGENGDHGGDDDDDDDDDVPVIALIRKDRTERNARQITIGSYIGVTYGRRWYIAQVKKKVGSSYEVGYMTPFKGLWKWGRNEVGLVSSEMILTTVSDLMEKCLL